MKSFRHGKKEGRMTKKKTGSKSFFISTFFPVLLVAFFILNLPFGVSIAEANEILEGKPYLTDEFTSFINVIRLQYELMFTSIFIKYPDLKIITHGYDFACPDPRIHFGLNPCNWHQPLLNMATGTGKWLYQSFMLKGITQPELQRKIVKTMIFDFNEMLMKMAIKPTYPNLFHIDCRGACTSRHDWYDELHPKSLVFIKIAQKYQECIDGIFMGKVCPVRSVDR